MRRIFLIMLIVAAFAVSCSHDDPAGVQSTNTATGTVVAYVHWDRQGLADMRVELVELGMELKTNSEGLARFEVPPGQYTLRAYDINQGGPALRYVDNDVVVRPKQTTRVDIVDCLPCV